MMKFFQVEQKLISNPLTDIRGEVFRQLDALNLHVPGGDVALTGGSRGIANIAEITRAVGDWLRIKGANPFLAPCMGSHNGATADGQKSMLETLGLSEDATGIPIRSSMETVRLGEVDSGSVFMDRNCFEAEAIILINRIKLHTAFAGPLQSGLTKMMVVGMGKIDSARTFHTAGPGRMSGILQDMGRLILTSGKILAGLGILEDGLDQTAELHAIPGADI